MAELSIANVINVSVALTPTAVGRFNTSNLAIMTSDTPSPVFSDGFKLYLEPAEVGQDFGTSSVTYKMALKVFSQSPNILAGDGYLVIIPLLASEKLDEAITRTKDLVQYFGVMSTQIELDADIEDAADIVQALDKILFFVERNSAKLDDSAIFDDIAAAGFYKTRGLFYGASTDLEALEMMSAYAGRALSTEFTGSNTTQTMHLKELTGIIPDDSMTQTLLDKALNVGADTYVSLAGVPAVFCSGSNRFFDRVYNLIAFVADLKIGGFNYLRQTSTKIPQTEGGMNGLKGAYRKVCEQYITNQFGAPGSWTSPVTFGNQSDLMQNIAQRGYYIYSQPISQQNQSDREDREAPLIQIAFKEAGAIQESDVIVNINA